MVQDHLTTTGTQNVDLILSQTQMKMLEVLSNYIFRVNNQIPY